MIDLVGIKSPSGYTVHLLRHYGRAFFLCFQTPRRSTTNAVAVIAWPNTGVLKILRSGNLRHSKQYSLITKSHIEGPKRIGDEELLLKSAYHACFETACSTHLQGVVHDLYDTALCVNHISWGGDLRRHGVIVFTAERLLKH